VFKKAFSLSFFRHVLNRDLRLIFASNLLGAFGDGLYAYLLPYYMKEVLQATPVEVGLLYALSSLTAAVTLFTAGMLADRYDRKKIMIVGWAAWIPAPLIFSYARNWVQMLPGMILYGFWLGGPTTTAYIVTSADKNRLTLTFTSISASWSLGYIFSPALGGLMAEKIGMQKVFYTAFILYYLAAFTLLFIKSQHGPVNTKIVEGNSIVEFLKTSHLMVLSAFFALTMFSLMMFRPFIPQFLADVHNYGDFEIGVLGSFSFLGSAVLGLLLGRLGDKLGKKYALSITLFLCSLSLALILCSGNFIILTAAFFLAGASYNVWSLMNAILGPMAPENMRAKWISIPQTISILASFPAPYIGGMIYNSSPNYTFILAILAASSIAIAATKILNDQVS
jgi:MFS family permease